MKKILSFLLSMIMLVSLMPIMAPNAEAAPNKYGADSAKYRGYTVYEFSTLDELKELAWNSSKESNQKILYRLTKDIYLTEENVPRTDTHFKQISFSSLGSNNSFVIDWNGHTVSMVISELKNAESKLFRGISIDGSGQHDSTLIITDTSASANGGVSLAANCYSNGPTSALTIGCTENTIIDGGKYQLTVEYTKFSSGFGNIMFNWLDEWMLSNQGSYAAAGLTLISGQCTIEDGSFITRVSRAKTSGKSDSADDFKYGYLSNVAITNHRFEPTKLTINGGKYESSRYNLFLNNYTFPSDDLFGLGSASIEERKPVINGGYFCGATNAYGESYTGGGICLCGDGIYSYNRPNYGVTKVIPVSDILGKDTNIIINGENKTHKGLTLDDIARQDNILIIKDSMADISSCSTVPECGNENDFIIEVGDNVGFFNQESKMKWWVPDDQVSLKKLVKVYDGNYDKLLQSYERSGFSYVGKTAGEKVYIEIKNEICDKLGNFITSSSKTYSIKTLKKGAAEIAALPKFTVSPESQVLKNGTKSFTITWETDKELTSENGLSLYRSVDGGETYQNAYNLRNYKNDGTYTYKLSATESGYSTKELFKLVMQTTVNGQYEYVYSKPFSITWTADGKEPYIGERDLYNMPAKNGEYYDLELPFNFYDSVGTSSFYNAYVDYYLLEETSKDEYESIDFYYQLYRSANKIIISIPYEESYKNSAKHFRFKVDNKYKTGVDTYNPGIGTYVIDIFLIYSDDTASISFYPNGGIGSMNTIFANEGTKVLLPSCKIAPPDGMHFSAWNVEYNYSGVNATVEAGDSITARGMIFVTPIWEKDLPYSISLDKKKIELPTNDSMKLTATVLPANQNQTVTWSSSDEKIATVDDNGLVTALRYGKVTITATAVDGAKASCVLQTRFYDVAGSNVKGDSNYQYYYDPVYWAADNGITTGYDKVYFGPQNECTRQELLIFLWRVAGKPAVKDDARKYFSDVTADPSTATNKSIAWAYEKGITKGYNENGKTLFKPTNPVTRQETMIFLYRTAKKPAVSGTLTFTDCIDLNKNTDTYKSILWGSKNGITGGYPDGTFGLENKCLREAIVTFLYRFNNKYHYVK